MFGRGRIGFHLSALSAIVLGSCFRVANIQDVIYDTFPSTPLALYHFQGTCLFSEHYNATVR